MVSLVKAQDACGWRTADGFNCHGISILDGKRYTMHNASLHVHRYAPLNRQGARK